MKHVRDMTRTYSQYFYRLTKKLSWLNWKNKTIFYSLKKKTVLTREKILVRKTLLNNCYGNCFVFVINSVNQELLDPYLVTKTRQWFFVDFIRFYFMIFTLNSIHWMSQTFIIQQNIFISVINFVLNNISVHIVCFLCSPLYFTKKQIHSCL